MIYIAVCPKCADEYNSLPVPFLNWESRDKWMREHVESLSDEHSAFIVYQELKAGVPLIQIEYSERAV